MSSEDSVLVDGVGLIILK